MLADELRARLRAQGFEPDAAPSSLHAALGGAGAQEGEGEGEAQVRPALRVLIKATCGHSLGGTRADARPWPARSQYKQTNKGQVPGVMGRAAVLFLFCLILFCVNPRFVFCVAWRGVASWRGVAWPPPRLQPVGARGCYRAPSCWARRGATPRGPRSPR